MVRSLFCAKGAAVRSREARKMFVRIAARRSKTNWVRVSRTGTVCPSAIIGRRELRNGYTIDDAVGVRRRDVDEKSADPLQHDGIVAPFVVDKQLSRASFAQERVQRIDLLERRRREQADVSGILGRFDDRIVFSQKGQCLGKMIVSDGQRAPARGNARNVSRAPDRFGGDGSVRIDEASNAELDSAEEPDDQDAAVRQAASLKRSENGSSGRT